MNKHSVYMLIIVQLCSNFLILQGSLSNKFLPDAITIKVQHDFSALDAQVSPAIGNILEATYKGIIQGATKVTSEQGVFIIATAASAFGNAVGHHVGQAIYNVYCIAFLTVALSIAGYFSITFFLNFLHKKNSKQKRTVSLTDLILQATMRHKRPIIIML